ncbi:hypothetical protein [Caballeronia sp. SEWSISQ10-4 2]
MRFHRQLKARLDPHGIFNPGACTPISNALRPFSQISILSR